MSTPTRKLSTPKRTPPAPARRTTATPSRPAASAAPSGRPARPAVRLSKQPPRPAGAGTGREPGPGEPAAVPEKRAADDPRFKRVVDKLNKNAAALRKHPPAAQKAAEAQAASKPQPKERLAKAQENKVADLQAAEGRKPEPESFLTLLRAEIDKAMPKTLGDTEDFMDEDQRRDLKGGVVGNIDQQKEAATGPVKETAKAPPDTAAVPERPSKDLPADTLPQAPVAPLNPASGMPAPKTEQEVSLQQSKADADRQLEENELTPTQLTKANDTRFSDVLKAKGAVETHADAAPQKYRTAEQATLAQAGARAVSDERKQGGQMKDVQAGAGRNVKSRQQAAKERDEARRREVTDNIERMFNQTKEKVEGKLAALETEVSSMFDRGLEEAIKRMTDYINLRKDAWKADRYGGLGGGALWLKDKLLGLPDEVQVFYDDGLKLFTKDLDALIVRIAAHVERRLKEAKDEVANGQKRIADYVDGLDKDLIAVGKAAAEEVSSRFDELRQGIDDKKNDLARNLAQRYKDAKAKADDAVKQMREADKGLLVKLAEKIGEVVRILREFKTKIMGMLRKSKDTIALIVADPIGFLSNLLAALGKGFGQFVNRIEDHLKEGFAAWLFGSLAGAGVEIPKSFSLPALFKFVLQVLGFTAAAVRSRVVRVVGERNVALAERAWDVIKTLIDSGPAALWDMAKEYLADLKEKIIDAARDWLIGAVIKAATTRLLMLFNPVGAIIQAIMMIYNTVMFFIERINQILALVEAVIESVASIALGKIGDAANWIEKSLARAIPVIIAFLARLLGLSGLAERVKDFITRLQTRVANAIDKVITKVVNGVKGLFGAGNAAKAGAARDAANKAGPGLQDVDKPFTLNRESHTLRGHIAAGRVTFLMASDGFQPLDRRLEGVRRTFVVNIFPARNLKGPAQALNVKINQIKYLADGVKKDVDAAPDDKKRGLLDSGVAQLSRFFGLIEQLLERYMGMGALPKKGDMLTHVPTNDLGQVTEEFVRDSDNMEVDWNAKLGPKRLPYAGKDSEWRPFPKKARDLIGLDVIRPLPKDDTLRVGPYGKESIPARSKSQSFTDYEYSKMDEFGYKYGSHTSGAKTPGAAHFTPDHQPTSELVPDGTPQRLYPHSLKDSLKQGGHTRQALWRLNKFKSRAP